MTKPFPRAALGAQALDMLARSTSTGTESDDAAVPKATLTVGMWVITVVASGWVVSYLLLGRPWSALIPFTYQVVSVATLWGLRRDLVRVDVARTSQLTIMLALPFLLHASLGGYVGSGGVAVWALCTPLLAYLYGSPPGRWMAGFAALALLAATAESTLADQIDPLAGGVRTGFFAINLIGLGLAIHLGIAYAVTERERRRVELVAANRQIEAERNRADGLLMSIMPSDIARRLKAGERRIADRIPAATVLAADIAGFTAMADRASPSELVEAVDELWTRFDRMVDGHPGLEKIKSVGDSYVVVGGLDPAGGDHLDAVIELALHMAEPQTVVGVGSVTMRVGVASGPIVAGVIGETRPAFGLWGDAVNTASRMESTGVPGRVQVTESVWDRIDRRFDGELRGVVPVKGKGTMKTYLLTGRRSMAEPADG